MARSFCHPRVLVFCLPLTVAYSNTWHIHTHLKKPPLYSSYHPSGKLSIHSLSDICPEPCSLNKIKVSPQTSSSRLIRRRTPINAAMGQDVPALPGVALDLLVAIGHYPSSTVLSGTIPFSEAAA